MEYTTSSFGVNIGTGLMIESALTPTTDRIDEDRLIPAKVKLDNYDIWYINLHSFIVNVISSYDKDTIDDILKSKKMTDIVINKVSDELEILISLIPIKLVFFYLGYPKYKDYLNSISNDTKGGKIYNKALEIMRVIKNESYKSDSVLSSTAKTVIMIEEFSNVIKNKNSKGLMTTSNAIDLIHNMPLLEFHTGVLKNRSLFYTKLKTKERIPFEELFLLSLGDKKNLIKSPLTFKEKKYLLEVILKKKMKPFARYNKSSILALIQDKELLMKLKAIPTIY